MAEWAEQEIVIPDGPYRGERYRHNRHPASRAFFDAVDSGNWTRIAATGPTQNGKTLMCYVIPTLYHLFEMQETVVIGLPTMAMAQDKWTEDLLPAIAATHFAQWLPKKGEGSKGGQVRRAIQFGNGATLRFMAAGGSDKQRAGFTSRVLAVTETDGMDQAGETSREADAIEQLEGRTRAFGRSGRRVYLECTVSIETGRIWQEYRHGTESKLVRPCPHCGVFVSPEREHLVGWQDADSETEAAERSSWTCPECRKPWTDDQRKAAARDVVLIHRGQQIDKRGKVTGDPPRTQTLGFRWSAIDNPFTSAADLGAEEWVSARSVDRENAEKKMLQFVWVHPYEPPEVELNPLTAEQVRDQQGAGLKKGQVPDDSLGIGVGIDTGKRSLHWCAVAVRQSGSTHVIDYGEQHVEADTQGMVRGLVSALQSLRGYFDGGWRSVDGKAWQPSQVWIDSGYFQHTEAVYEFCRHVGKDCEPGRERYRPSKGYGEGQQQMTPYRSPDRKTKDVRYIGKDFHVTRLHAARMLLVHMNADAWKCAVHDSLAMDRELPGALTVYEPSSSGEHIAFSNHLTAERRVENWTERRGQTFRWERVSRVNHWLDATYQALAACQFIFEQRSREAEKGKTGGWFQQQQKRGRRAS